MTLFGKIIFGSLMLVGAGAAFYGVTSHVQYDEQKETVAMVENTSSLTGSTTEVVVTSSTTENPTKGNGKKIPFAEFMKQGGSYKCTVTQTVATMTTDGTVYIHDANVRGNFSISVQGQTIETSMIARDGYTYTWTNVEKGVGHKVKVNAPTTNESGSGPAQGTYAWNGEQIGDYSCSPWVTDDSLFELPKDITFTEVR